MEGPRTSWWARGLLFENCNCTVVCPGHVHFDQLCTHERCRGYWAVRFQEGVLGDVDLAGVDAVVAYDSPQHMISGGWTELTLVGQGATEAQVQAADAILSGRAGGPWAVLDRFVETRLPTRIEPMEFGVEDRAHTIRVPGVLESRVEAIKSRDRTGFVRFENMFNQVHSGSQVVARGTSSLTADPISVETDGTHGLWSSFHWRVGAP